MSVVFTVSQDNSLEDILKLCLCWRKKATNTDIGHHIPEISKVDISNININGTNEKLSSYILNDDGKRIAVFRQEMVKELERWEGIVTASEDSEGIHISYVQNFTSSSPTFFIPSYNKPYLFKLFQQNLKCGKSGPLKMNGLPIYLDDTNFDEFYGSDFNILQQVDAPIVYVSRLSNGEFCVDPSELSSLLYGMAHVFIAPEQESKWTNHRLFPYNGAIGIYDKNIQEPWIFIPDSTEHIVSHRKIFNKLRIMHLSREVPEKYTFRYIENIKFKEDIKNIRQRINKEMDEILNGTIDDLDNKNAIIEEKEKEINRLLAGTILVPGKEQEKYSGEIKDTVVEALELWRDSHPREQYTRRYIIIDDIILHNEKDGSQSHNQNEIKRILNKYDAPQSIAREIKHMNLEIINDDGEHPKIQFKGDDRVRHGIPSTPGDKRGRKNLASEINKKFF